MRKWPAVPLASALESNQVPAFAFDPLDAAANQSAGNDTVARTVPLSAVAHVAGGAPENTLRIADAPVTVSMASSMPFRTAVLN